MIEETGIRLFKQFHNSDDRRCAPEVAAANWPDALWKAVNEAGIPLALIDEADGGFGFAPEDTCQLIGIAARYTAAIPLGETLLGNRLLTKAGQAPSSEILTLLPEPLAMQIDATGSAQLLDSKATRTPFGRHATAVLGFAQADDGNTYLLEFDAVSVESHSHNLAGEARDTLTLPQQLTNTQFHPLPITADNFRALCALMRASAIAGIAEAVLELCVDYANERQQFGRPIGKFQAIQHYLARMAGEVAASRVAVDSAARNLGDAEKSGSAFLLQAAAAKLRSGEAAGQIAQLAHQIHGAIGFSQEHSLHGYTRRLWSWREEYGNEQHWAAIMGNTLCQNGAEQLWPTLSNTQELRP